VRIGLLGFEGSGKTTVLNAVADVPVPVTPGAPQTETHVQVVKVRDARLERCRDIFQPRKYTPAGLEVWDPPGLPIGGGAADQEKRQRRLVALRDLDAYLLVVRDFTTDRYAYERPAPDPASDLARLAEELITSDFLIAQARAERLREQIVRKARTMEQDRLELQVLERCLERLEAGRDLSDLALDEADEKRIRGFQFFSRKPCALLVNGARGVPAGLGESSPLRLRARIAMDAQIEAELNAMDPAERPAFLAEFGISDPAADRFVREVYRAVGLISFFTVGEDEVRAWTLHEGDTALDAAARIHTDLAKGFVRAEVFPFATLDEAGSMRELKARGALRLEPKDYRVKDGDIVHIRSAL
jgi:ribosome-binding ATPase YchF (GTP1/OBG family)